MIIRVVSVYVPPPINLRTIWNAHFFSQYKLKHIAHSIYDTFAVYCVCYTHIECAYVLNDHEGGTLVHKNWTSDSYFWMFNFEARSLTSNQIDNNFPIVRIYTSKCIHTEEILLLINRCVSPFFAKSQHQLISSSLMQWTRPYVLFGWHCSCRARWNATTLCGL